jgi:23S rRNA (guanosine2251-2'-O)-methyltransferase
MFLYGKNSVYERLKTNPASIKEIFLQDNFADRKIKELIRINDIPLECVSAKKLSHLKYAKDLQGIVARTEHFEYVALEDLLERPEKEKPTLIFLDRINDPHNLGVIIRTAACFGGYAVVIPRFHTCAVNETVLHVASGGENYTPVAMVTNLSNALLKAKDCGYWILGAVMDDAAGDISKLSLPFPLAIVLGSEGEGIRYGVQKRLDIKARIPMCGAPLSFNVSQAAAIFCHEAAKQRQKS